jgi:hypothetical protein
MIKYGFFIFCSLYPLTCYPGITFSIPERPSAPTLPAPSSPVYETCDKWKVLYNRTGFVITNDRYKGDEETHTDEEIINYFKVALRPSQTTNPDITSIEIEGYDITIPVLSFLASTFPNLKVLKLSPALNPPNTLSQENSTLSDEYLRVIASFSQLTHLHLRGGHFTDEGVKALINLKNLTKLTLRGKLSFTNYGVLFEVLPKLYRLCLNEDRIERNLPQS